MGKIVGRKKKKTLLGEPLIVKVRLRLITQVIHLYSFLFKNQFFKTFYLKQWNPYETGKETNRESIPHGDTLRNHRTVSHQEAGTSTVTERVRFPPVPPRELRGEAVLQGHPTWSWQSGPLTRQGPTSHCLMNCRRPVPLLPVPRLKFSFLPHETSHIEETKEAMTTTSEAV